MNGYWHTTRHPWPCLMFVLPLLVMYEGSMLYQSMEGLKPFRAGIDAWLSTFLSRYQWSAEFLPSLFIGFLCLGWAVIRWDRSPPENISILAGMFLESISFSLALWGVGALLTAQSSFLSLSQRTIQALALMGRGLFEEILFRLLGFGLLIVVFKLIFRERTALWVALFVSSFGFAAAHYLGPYGEAWQMQTFLFRSLAGLVFAMIFHYRGIGIAVGTHSAYNLMIGLLA